MRRIWTMRQSNTTGRSRRVAPYVMPQPVAARLITDTNRYV
ncbi:hypothetical protein SBV1_1000007 [Verrucomicrobia bacterium]|nr:hypothetical protein SBV1_1000007 [Verrucomicrobiota bacterium]